MVGKIIIKDFPEIQQFDLGTNLDDVRDHLSNIDFSKPGIYILKLQPGLGKTYAIKEFLKHQNNFLITTASHKLIFGEYERMGAKHWMKFKDECNNYGEIENLHSCGVSIRMICSLNRSRCDKRKCNYWKQFQTKKAVAPLTHLSNDRVLFQRGEKKGEFKFDILVVDEAMKEFKEIEYDKKGIEDIIEVIENYVNEDYPIRSLFDDFINFLDTNDFPSQNQTQQLNQIKNMALREAINKKEWEDIKVITKLNIFELRQYIYYHNIHEDILVYPEPFLYYVFDLALQGITVIFLDATFDEEAFKVLLGRYIYENSIINRQQLINQKLNCINDLEIKFFESNLKNRNTHIYRMDKNNYYFKKGLFNYDQTIDDPISVAGHKTIDEIRDYIKKSKRKYTNVGIITYKGLIPYFNDLGSTEYFFNNRGSNELENVEALFIIGTPQQRPRDTLKEYNKLCLTQLQPENTYRMTYEKIEDGFQQVRKLDGKKLIRRKAFKHYQEKKPSRLTMEGYDDYENELEFNNQVQKGIVDADVFFPLPDFDYQKNESEKYQAIMRARLFREESPVVYVFGDIPAQIKEEFSGENLDKKHTKEYFIGSVFSANQFKGIYPLPLLKLINDTKIENSSSTSSDIAQKLKLYKKNKESGYNSSIVTKIIDGEISIKQITIIHKALRNNINDLKKIQQYSKIDERFITDFMFYSTNGDFINTE